MRKRILVIDDVPDWRDQLSDILTDDYEVEHPKTLTDVSICLSRIEQQAVLVIRGMARSEQTMNQPPNFKRSYRTRYALLGGAFGHTFGIHDVHAFDPGWKDHLDSPGTRSMDQFRRLLRSRLRLCRRLLRRWLLWWRQQRIVGS